VRPPLPAAVDRGGSSNAGEHRPDPRRRTCQTEVAKQLTTGDPLVVHHSSTRGGPAEPARLEREGLSRIERRAAPRAADGGTRVASSAPVGCRAKVAEALGLAIGVRCAMPGLRAEDVLGAEASEVADSREAVRAVADVAAARPARGIGRITGAVPIAEPVRLPLRTTVDRRGRSRAREHRRGPRRGTRQPDVAKHLATGDPIGFHRPPPVSLDGHFTLRPGWVSAQPRRRRPPRKDESSGRRYAHAFRAQGQGWW
jgi:hypothetical protein